MRQEKKQDIPEQRMWRVRDVRRLVKERLGIDATPGKWSHWRAKGIVPKTESDNRWGYIWTDDEVEQIITGIAESMKLASEKKKYHYHIPGKWRSTEIRRQIKLRLNMEFNIGNWEYAQKIGLIPEPEVPSKGVYLYWSDAQVEEIIANIQCNVTITQGDEI